MALLLAASILIASPQVVGASPVLRAERALDAWAEHRAATAVTPWPEAGWTPMGPKNCGGRIEAVDSPAGRRVHGLDPATAVLGPHGRPPGLGPGRDRRCRAMLRPRVERPLRPQHGGGADDLGRRDEDRRSEEQGHGRMLARRERGPPPRLRGPRPAPRESSPRGSAWPRAARARVPRGPAPRPGRPLGRRAPRAPRA